MRFHIDHHNGVPIFRQLQDQIKWAIVSGIWKPGDAIPSTRQVSEELQVNPMTISKAFSNLELEGWLERRRGLPTVVSTQLKLEAIQSTREQLIRELLQPIATRVQQMGLSAPTAERIWSELLSKPHPTHESTTASL